MVYVGLLNVEVALLDERLPRISDRIIGETGIRSSETAAFSSQRARVSRVLPEERMTRYTTFQGRVVEVAHESEEVSDFLGRVRSLASDPNASTQDLLRLVYGLESPVTRRRLLLDGGAGHSERLDSPAYRVMLDQLYRKHVDEALAGDRTSALDDTLTVAEAAESLGISASAVRQAIRKGAIPAFKRAGVYLVPAKEIAAYSERTSRRGPQAKPAITGRIGQFGRRSLKVKVLDKEIVARPGRSVVDLQIKRFHRAAVLEADGVSARFYELIPAEKVHSIRVGPLNLRGRFRAVEQEMDPGQARRRFDSFVPS